VSFARQPATDPLFARDTRDLRPAQRCRDRKLDRKLDPRNRTPDVVFGGHLLIQRVFQLLDYRGQMQYESIDKVATVARSRSVLAADSRRLLRWRLTRA
jgi:hypothetical protein